jgi:uncharacterized protein (UPF0335 family)
MKFVNVDVICPNCSMTFTPFPSLSPAIILQKEKAKLIKEIGKLQEENARLQKQVSDITSEWTQVCADNVRLREALEHIGFDDSNGCEICGWGEDLDDHYHHIARITLYDLRKGGE